VCRKHHPIPKKNKNSHQANGRLQQGAKERMEQLEGYSLEQQVGGLVSSRHVVEFPMGKPWRMHGQNAMITFGKNPSNILSHRIHVWIIYVLH